jgi:hypothetical protein
MKKKAKKVPLRVKGQRPAKMSNVDLSTTEGGLYPADYDPEPYTPPPPPSVPSSLKLGGGFCSSSTSNRSQVIVRRRPR